MSEETRTVSGACLCGKVTYQASVKVGVGVCHCRMCRSWGAGPFMSVRAVEPVTFSGSKYIGTYSSSAWAERGFCQQCGSNLYYRLLPRAEFPDGAYMLSAGSVTDQNDLHFEQEVFIDHAPDWYEFSEGFARQRLTEAQALEAFE